MIRRSTRSSKTFEKDLKMERGYTDTKDTRRQSINTKMPLALDIPKDDNIRRHSVSSGHDSEIEPMDISNKTQSTLDSDPNSSYKNTSSSFKDSQLDVDSDGSETQPSNTNPDMKYTCPICYLTFNNPPDFTSHIRSHNNVNEDNINMDPTKTFACKICSKVLSSGSCLDRHVLVHSGERPFRCRICAVTFTTNGNMHRHMRTHSLKADCYESDASSDSSSAGAGGHSITSRNRRCENNNRLRIDNKRKSTDDDSVMIKRKIKTIINNNNITEASPQRYCCPVCEREDFASLNVLENHVEAAHPDFEVRCQTCNLAFKNHKVLNLHRFMVHREEDKKNAHNTVTGFKDLTFVDFSSEKFPVIARAVCEKSIHTATAGNQRFECEKCTRAFPCASSLGIHSKDCSVDYASDGVDNPTDYSLRSRKASETSEEDVRRDDFFANLDLQNKSIPNSPVSEPAMDHRAHALRAYLNHSQDSNRDLADIQSIISVASAEGMLKQLSSKPHEVHANDCKDPGEDEAQDVFSAEFRKMKLRGEFPCRLCTAVFPNLRALKGHNRVHLSGTGPGPYRCNMCPHCSSDKAALVRHMRTHNGDRPYECSLCNYAFTTKANCERHLRNRHAKVTRDEVKRSIIYHPSEDPNNEENNKIKEDGKRTTIFNTPETDNDENELRIPNDRSTPVSHLMRDRPLIFKEQSLNHSVPTDLSIVIPQCNINIPDILAFERKTSSISQLPVTKIQVKSMDKLTRISELCESDSDAESSVNENIPNFAKKYPEECPIDLSMDVLDLSKKSTPIRTPSSNDPQDFTKRTLEFNNNQAAAAMIEKTQQFLLAQQHLLNGALPKLDPASFYANQLQQMYRNTGGFTVPPAFPVNPFFLPPHPFLTPPTNPQDIADMKERLQKEIIRGLQLSGGSVVMNNMALASERLQAFHQQTLSMTKEPNPELTFNIKSEEDIKPLNINTEPIYSPTHNETLRSPKKHKDVIQSHSPGAVKMVIKNGVLMPKQKQRRYRTERPFACDHCSARFTLRSNMERHVKQQHPQFWAQRQRSGVHISRRGAPVAAPPPPCTTTPLRPPEYSSHINVNITKQFNISDQVKYAILAQQLKSQVKLTHEHQPVAETIDDEEDALIIDEEIPEEVKVAVVETKNSNPVTNDNSIAKKVANEILQVAKNMEVKEKDFDLKITSNLIPKTHLELARASAANADANFVTKTNSLEAKLAQVLANKNAAAQRLEKLSRTSKMEEADLVPVSRLLDNAVSQLPFGQYFRGETTTGADESEGEEEGLVASGSTSEGNNSGSDENRSESDHQRPSEKKKSAYSLAPNRVSCPYCHRKFPWSSSLRRHILTHTGQKPYKCAYCPLLFTTKSNCDRHLLRKHGNINQQQQQPTPTPETNTSNANTTSPSNNNNNANNPNSQSFLMRNVPERPFKCAGCPSSTFSTLNNLKKHMSSKHSNTTSSNDNLSGNSRPTSPNIAREDEVKVENVGSPVCLQKDAKITDWEAQIGSKYNASELVAPSNVQNSDLPFKCHLCEGSYPERQDALNHIKDLHLSEYELLVSKGALDAEHEAQTLQHHEENEENGDAMRGKFPDYANRKVMCAFCLRRFWSAEDLRRHMRTHTGERPFQCDVCRRRFTLKHSMLRHRKKHSNGYRDSQVNTISDNNDNNEDHNDNDDISVASDEEITVKSFNKHNNKSTVSETNECENPGGSDLIGNLLGISDQGILNKVLLSSADEAAKLLGVEQRK